MGVVSEFNIDLFEPSPDPEEEKEHLKEEKEREDYFWEVTCQAWPIDTKEKELRVKEKCARLAQKLRCRSHLT